LNGDAQLVLWLAALALAYFVIWAGFPLPRLGHSHSTDYPISGAHMAQRCLLFVTIALGESILITGSDFGDLPGSLARDAAFVAAFAGAVAIWWIYFDRHAEAAAAIIERSEDPARLGLIAYTYAHIAIIAGIIVFAAGNEIAIAHPRDEVSAAQSLLILGGPALFLAGTWLFKMAVWRHVSISRTLGLAALALLSPMAMMTSSLAMLGAATTVLVGVAGYDLMYEWRLNRVAATEVRGSLSQAVADTTEA
jgi:low temperature requirement protein LtrA